MSSIRKIYLVLLMAIFAVSLALLGTFMSHKSNQAVAATATTNLEMDIKVKDGDNLVAPEKDDDGNIILAQGQKFNLIATFSSTYVDYYWYTLETVVGPLSSDTSLKRYDKNVSDYLSADTANCTFGFTPDAGSEVNYINLTTDGFKDEKDDRYGLRFNFGISQHILASTSNDCVFNIEITIADDMPVDKQFNFGMLSSIAKNEITYSSTPSDIGDVIDTSSSGKITSNSLPIKIREVSNDATLKELKLEHSDTEGTLKTFTNDVDADFKIADTMAYSSDSKNLKDFKVTPVANAKYVKCLELSLNNPFSTDEETEEPEGFKKIDSTNTNAVFELQAGNNTLYIRVTAEDGTIKIYTITITMAYARLSALSAAASTNTAGVEISGLDTEFVLADYDPTSSPRDTIKVYVPSDYDNEAITGTHGVTINAEVLTGYNASTTIDVSTTNCTANSSVESGDNLVVSGFSDNATLTLTLTASDGTTKRLYDISFVIVSIDISLDIKVKKVTVGEGENEYIASDEESATTESVDYYYSLAEVTDNPSLIITVSDKKSVKIVLNENDISGTPAEDADSSSLIYTVTDAGDGKYIITVTAEAGNTKDYTVLLVKAIYLKLADDSTYDFIMEYVEVDEDDEDEKYFYRRTYAYLDMEHGVDDADFETVVLGQILPKTTVNDFLQNIHPNQVNQITLFSSDDEEIFKNGNVGEDVEDEEYLNDADEYAIGTGWYIVFNNETVYISVLGDITGDGVLNARDSSNINSYIMKNAAAVSMFDSVLVRLSSYVVNSGRTSARDSSTLNSVIMKIVQLENYLPMPEKEEE